LQALEFHALPGWDRILSDYRPEIADEYMEVPERPALGIELDEDETRRYALAGEPFFD
jgi:L-alanine-DL-glutamate epimerase-like enolase superfamily enzyme